MAYIIRNFLFEKKKKIKFALLNTLVIQRLVLVFNTNFIKLRMYKSMSACPP